MTTKINLEDQLKDLGLDLTPTQKMTLGLGMVNLLNSTGQYIARYNDLPEQKERLKGLEETSDNMLMIAGNSIDYGITKFKEEYDAVEDFGFLGDKRELVRDKVARGMEVTFKLLALTEMIGDYFQEKMKAIPEERGREMSKNEVQKLMVGYADEAVQRLGGLEELKAPVHQLVKLMFNLAESKLY